MWGVVDANRSFGVTSESNFTRNFKNPETKPNCFQATYVELCFRRISGFTARVAGRKEHKAGPKRE